MAPKIWWKLFSKQRELETKAINTSISDSFESRKSDLFINNNQKYETLAKTIPKLTNCDLNQDIIRAINRDLIVDQNSYLSSTPSPNVSHSSSFSMANDSMSSRSVKSTANSSPKPVANDVESHWPKVGVLLYNSSGQCGYQYLPQTVYKKLSNILNKKINNKNINNNNSYDNNKRNIETIICEMIFGSVALNFMAKNSSKIHKLTDDLLMTSFIFQIDFSNGMYSSDYLIFYSEIIELFSAFVLFVDFYPIILGRTTDLMILMINNLSLN